MMTKTTATTTCNHNGMNLAQGILQPQNRYIQKCWLVSHILASVFAALIRKQNEIKTLYGGGKGM